MERFEDIRENFMEYWLFPPNDCDVNEVLNRSLAMTSAEIGSFIWQNDCFNLTIKEDRDQESKEFISPKPYLYGSTDYGDNVGDLWFITYMLRKLTVEIDGLVAKMKDTDGEFLLIEAADVLPKWINPETAVNRVYIYQGKLHIVSPETLNKKTVPTVDAALKSVREKTTPTEATESIQKCINEKLDRYPALALQEVHSCTCYLPVKAAQILTDTPQLVSDAVRSFYLRDPLDLKRCQPMKTFFPDNRIYTKVKMTRCLYAQLIQQNFHPPKRSIWNIPASNDPNHRSHDLGMKLTYGLEILCANAVKRSGHTLSSQTTVSDNDEKWKQYKHSLDKVNYFQGEIEGSIKYKELMVQAKQFYMNNMKTVQANASLDRLYSNKGAQILNQLENIKVTEDELREKEKNLSPDDDDSWLSLTYEELDQLLEGYKTDTAAPRDSAVDPDTDPRFDPSVLVDTMSAFINKKSNLLTGVEAPNSDIRYDSKGFLAALEKMMNGENEQLDSDDDSSLDDYESDDSHDDTANLMSKPENTRSSKKAPAMKKAKDTENEKQHPKQETKEPEPEIEDFMEMMDRELSKTHIGKSFEKQSNSTSSKPKGQIRVAGTDTKNRTPVVKATLADTEELTDDEDQEADGPVDVDFNTVKNLLESYSQQMGLPGPTSNLLGSMGVNIPQNSDTN